MLDVIFKFLCRHYGAVVLRFGSGSAQVGNGDNAVHTDEFVIGKVGDDSVNLARFDRFDDVVVDEQVAARAVDYHHAVLHPGYGILVYATLCLGSGRHVQGDIVGYCVKCAQVGNRLDAAVQLGGKRGGKIGVVAHDVHAQGKSGVGYQPAYCAQTDNAQRFAENFLSHKGFFAFFNRLSHVLAAQRLHPVYAAHYLAGSDDKRADNQFFHRVGVGSGGVEYAYAALRHFIERNVVHARACTGNGYHAFGKRVFVHVRAAHKYGYGCACGIGYSVVVRGENVAYQRRYCV